jgi:hypothetical protein
VKNLSSWQVERAYFGMLETAERLAVEAARWKE